MCVCVCVCFNKCKYILVHTYRQDFSIQPLNFLTGKKTRLFSKGSPKRQDKAARAPDGPGWDGFFIDSSEKVAVLLGCAGQEVRING